MAELDEKLKALVVTRLAHFERIADIQRELREEHGLEIPHNRIGGYDPTRTYFEAGERWRKLFEDEREAYMAGLRDIPIANQRWRLGELARNYEAARKSGNRVLANQTLRQAAEEVGGSLTNERSVKVTKGAEELTPDERRAALTEVIRNAMAAWKADPAGTQPAPAATQ